MIRLGLVGWAEVVAWAGGAVALGACGDDFSSVSDEDPAAAGTAAAEDADGGEDDNAVGSSGGVDDDSGLSDSADETCGDDCSAPDGDETGPEDLGCPFDCGAGVCELDGLGQARCACDAGAVLYGLTCFACQDAASAFDIEIPRALVNFEIRVNGQVAPDDEYENGRLLLRDPLSGDTIVVGETREQFFTAIVAPGSYELHYQRILGGGIVPRNVSARLDSLEISGDVDVLVDIPVVTLEGQLLVDGELAQTDEYESGELWLVEPGTGDEVRLGTTYDGSYSVRVTPGAYEVHYRRTLGGDLVPRNGDAIVGAITLDPETADTSLVIDHDVPVIEIAGAITLAGAAPPDSEYETALLAFRDPATGDEFPIGETRDGAYSARVVPGLYDVVYDRVLGGQAVPANDRAFLSQADARVGAVDIDVPAVSISGTFAIDGAVPGTDPTNDAIITLRDLQTGDELELGHLTSGSFDRVVIPQQYAVDYGVLANAGGLPANTQGTLTTVTIEGDMVLPVDVVAASVGGTFTVQGGVPPTSEYDDARIFLRSPAGDSVLLGNTRLGAFSVPVLAGSYDVVYVLEAGGAQVPANGEAILETGVLVAGDTALDVDVPSVQLSGSITVAGEIPPTSANDRGVIVAENIESGDVVTLGGTESGSYLRALTRGRYVIAYRNEAPGELLPHNSNAALACITIGP